MHLATTATSPLLVRAALEALRLLHIGGGAAALAAGTLALLARKGGPMHRWAGRVFLVSMLTMALIGAAVAPWLPQRASVVPALFALYLVTTGALTARRAPGRTGNLERAACVFAFIAALLGGALGLQALAQPNGLLDDAPAANYFVFAGLIGAAGVADVRWLRNGGAGGPQRLARHLWRMCAALLLAAVSFFLGQQQFLPAAWRGSPALWLPELAVAGPMVWWLLRLRRRAL